MDKLFEKLADRLTEKVPALKWVDWEAGQIDMPEESYPIQFPAVFIDFPEIRWMNMAGQVMTGDVTIDIRVAFDIYEDFNHVAPDRSIALQRMQLLNNIHQMLQGFEGEHFNRLDRRRTTTERRTDGLKVVTLQYVCNMRDNYAMPEHKFVPLQDIKVNRG